MGRHLELADSREGEGLEARVTRLEDIAAITRLKYRYAECGDNGFDADGMLPLFAADGTLEGNLFGGPYRGDDLGDFIRSNRSTILWSFHCMIAPVITLASDGCTAKGTWYLLELATMKTEAAPEGAPVLIAARYDDEFVKQDGHWLFKSVYGHFEQVADITKGWVREPFPGDRGVLAQ